MTDRPYTDDDLRHEAARQHKNLTEDPDFMGIGEGMDGTPIPSTVVDLEPDTSEPLEMSRTWDQLGEDDFDAAQRAIDDLLTNAADVSEWAVNLGADGLEPIDAQLTADTGDRPLFRIHFAVRPDMPDDMRTALVEGLAVEIAKYL
ncbi:hypothetical protein ACH40E_03080 [Streptomyces acidicola]|uniref:hypothetical protein n=1 Tax=Streptomyces acidicola TaxID=2596892 RepID=UPI00379EB717